MGIFWMCLGVLLALYGVFIMSVSNFTLGVLVNFLLAALFLLYGRFHRAICARGGWVRAVRYICYGGLAAFLALSAFLCIYGSSAHGSYDEDAVIVLGAGLRGDRVSLTLAMRLDRAVDYHAQNPDALIVVSGGQGAQESVTEAYAMRQYLLTKGVPDTAIITEERSTSTYENFAFSRDILNKRLNTGWRVAYITNVFHVYRAGLEASAAGVDAVGYGADEVWYSMPVNYFREVLAVLKTWVFPR